MRTGRCTTDAGQRPPRVVRDGTRSATLRRTAARDAGAVRCGRSRVHDRGRSATDVAGGREEVFAGAMGGMGGTFGGVGLAWAELAAWAAWAERRKMPDAGGRQSRSICEQGVAPDVAAEEVGELFRYEIQLPVALTRNQSAMFPIVNQPVAGEKVSIYNAQIHAKHPHARPETHQDHRSAP